MKKDRIRSCNILWDMQVLHSYAEIWNTTEYVSWDHGKSIRINSCGAHRHPLHALLTFPFGTIFSKIWWLILCTKRSSCIVAKARSYLPVRRYDKPWNFRTSLNIRPHPRNGKFSTRSGTCYSMRKQQCGLLARTEDVQVLHGTMMKGIFYQHLTIPGQITNPISD